MRKRNPGERVENDDDEKILDSFPSHSSHFIQSAFILGGKRKEERGPIILGIKKEGAEKEEKEGHERRIHL